MTISQTLANATSGLSAVSRLVGVASNNIANALTPGYSRRDATLAELATSGIGSGVRVAGIRIADAPVITQELRSAAALAARDGKIATAARAVAEIFGSAESANSIFGRFSAFDASLRALADAPESVSGQSQLLATMKSLVSSVGAGGARIQELRAAADAEISSAVSEVNAALKEVQKLNIAIEKAVTSGADVSALLDRRKSAISQLNDKIPVRELTRENGKIDLMTNEGILLLAGAARSIEFSQRAVITAQDAYAGGAGTLSGLAVDGIDITPGGSGRAFGSGFIAGLFKVRDEILPEAARQLDLFAEELIRRFSAHDADPTIPPGAPGLFTDAGALSSPLPGLSSRLSVNIAVDPEQGGMLFRLRDGVGATIPGPTGSDVILRGLLASVDARHTSPAELGGGKLLSLPELAAELTASASAQLQISENQKQSSQTYADSMAEAELSAIGVDVDAELQKLLALEKAYAANARVVETVAQMLQRLLEI